MTSDEFRARRHALVEGVDALLVTHLPNARYLTGFTGSSAHALVFEDGETILFTDPRYSIQARAEAAGCRVVIAKGVLLAAVTRELAKRRVRKLGFETTRITHAGAEFLKSHLKLGVTMKPLDGVVELRRMTKSTAEIAAIRRAVETNSGAFQRALTRLRPGRTTESELAAEIDYAMRRLGADGPAFETIVASGRRSALPHARPTSGGIGKNELLLIDMGAAQDGYASDMTRMVAVGRINAASRRLYAAVLEAQLAAIDAVRPGVTAAGVDRAARRTLRARKLDKAFVHSTGHGLGLEIHEAPRLGRKDQTRLQEGMAITIEPGAYIEGFCGVRIEDTVVVTRAGCDVLTPTSKQLLEI
ncbi:MAG: M24 family metallopeptidase [Bryobacteraceae bacterium]